MTKRILFLIPFLLLGLSTCESPEGSMVYKNVSLNLDKTAQKIDHYLTRMEALGFSGAIVVGKEDKIILSKGYGFADRENRQAFTPQTVQSNGSNTKQFTGAAILLLESQNLLSLSDSLPSFFKGVPEDKQPITLHQLLSHSSGLIQGVGYDEDPIAFDLFFKKLMAEHLEFEPGSSYNYSNAGYSILGKIVAQVSGMNYETFLYENLLKPVGMTKTGYTRPDWKDTEMAIGYRKGKEWGQVYKKEWLEDGPGWHLRANGGLHTTAEDMYRWANTLKGKGALNKESIEKWTSGYVMETNGYSKYGYGLVSYEKEGWGKIITHDGSNGIFTSCFFWSPEKEFFFYIHGNSSMVPVYNLEDNILSAAADNKFDLPPRIDYAKTVDPKQVQPKAGSYQQREGTIELMVDDIRLVGKLYGQNTLDLLFGHNDPQKETFNRLNQITEVAMKKLEQGDKNAFAGLVSSDVNSETFTRTFLNRIAQIGNLESLNIIGTFENIEGSKFHKYGPYTTFVYAKFKNWNQYWNLVWNEDETYHGNYSGPWPQFIFIPLEDGKVFKGIREVYPWNTVEVSFANDCLVIKGEKFCK